jgi:hypothetical protein
MPFNSDKGNMFVRIFTFVFRSLVKTKKVRASIRSFFFFFIQRTLWTYVQKIKYEYKVHMVVVHISLLSPLQLVSSPGVGFVYLGFLETVHLAVGVNILLCWNFRTSPRVCKRFFHLWPRSSSLSTTQPKEWAAGLDVHVKFAAVLRTWTDASRRHIGQWIAPDPPPEKVLLSTTATFSGCPGVLYSKMNYVVRGDRQNTRRCTI